MTRGETGYLEISSDAQSLESVLGLVIHGAAGAFGGPCRIELGDDLVDRARLRRHGKRDVSVGPMEDRMDPQMRASRQTGVEVIPEFRRLIAHVPVALEAARREHPLLGAGRFLVAVNASEQAIEAVFGKGKFQPL